MPKLLSMTPAGVIRILEKNGFSFERSSGSHQVFRNPETHRIVVVPVHKKDLPKGTLHEILRQAGLKKGDLGKKPPKN